MKQRTILMIGIALVATLLYRTYKSVDEELDTREQYQLVQEYLLSDRMENSKPILWVHLEGEINARNWESFNSRNSTKLNQPYVYVTLKSIFDKCKDSFNVCLIDDGSFRRLIPNWDMDIEKVASPVKERTREIGLASLLYYHGGLLVPASTLCLKDLVTLYESSDAFAVELPTRGVLAPDVRFMGCAKHSAKMKGLLHYESSHLWDQASEFKNITGEWCKKHFKVIDGVSVATRTIHNDAVQVQDLLGKSPIAIHRDALAIYIPADEILLRPAYGWFARLSVDQLARSDLTIAKHMLASY